MFRIHRYILREHIAPFFFSFAIITVLFLLDFMLQIINSVFNKGLSVYDVLQLFLLNMAWMVALSLPMSMLIASLIAYGRMAGDNEIVAFKAAGVHPLKVMIPSLSLGAVVCIGLIIFNDRVLPDANHRAASLLNDIAQRKPVSFIEEGFVVEDFPGYRLLIGRINALSGSLQDIKIYQSDKDGQSLTFAERGTIKYINGGTTLKLSLFNGETHQVSGASANDYFRTIFKEQAIYLENEQARKSTAGGNHVRGDREMSIDQMNEKIKGFRSDADRARKEIAAVMALSGVTKLDTLAAITGTLRFPFESISYAAHQNRYSEERRRLLQLERHAFYLNNSLRQISKYSVEVHKKYSIPVACIVFVLIGAPIGIMARTGGLGAGAVYSLFFFVLYWVFLIGGETIADNRIIPAWLAMWSPNILIGGIGVWLLVRMITGRDFSISLKISHLIEWIKKIRAGKKTALEVD